MLGGPFAQEGFEGDEGNIEYLTEPPPDSNIKILIVGAGGLGCELVKNMALSGFKDIHLIDLDTIDVSNLNRQFLFRSGDEGKYKADVAARRIQEVVPDCKVTPYNQKIQTFANKWYAQFHVVIAGLDNQEARRWLNETLCDLVQYDENGEPDPETIIPMIDGGTEAFQGQTRIFFPHQSSCFQCQKGSDAGGPDLHMCTVAVTPRIPEHCAMYAHMFLWDKLISFNSAVDYKLGEALNPTPLKLDKDNGHHMTWLFNRGQEWADKHGIKGLTYSLTQQVIKNIIPAVAATNATVAAACVNECFKYISFCAPNMNNYQQYNGSSGTYSRTFKYGRVKGCEACQDPIMIKSTPGMTGQNVLDILKNEHKLEHLIMASEIGGDGMMVWSSKGNQKWATNEFVIPEGGSRLFNFSDDWLPGRHLVWIQP